MKPAIENLFLDIRTLGQLYLVGKSFKQSKQVRSPMYLGINFL